MKGIAYKDVIYGRSSDRRVEQIGGITTNANYEILLSGTSDDNYYIGETRKTASLTYNPSKNRFINMGSSSVPSEIRVLDVYNADPYFTKSLQISATDITLTGFGTGIGSNTWDGTNLSLKSALSDTNTAVSGKVNKSGDTMTGNLTMAGQDILLGTSSSSSNDSADIVWNYGNGQEKSRIWTDDTYTTIAAPNYRVYKEDGTSLYSGKLAIHNKSDHLAPISNGTRLASADQQGDYNASLFTFMATSSMTTNKPPEDAHIIHSCWDNNGGWDVQLAIGHSNAIYTRSMNNGTWTAWKKYAYSDHTHSYLPLSGGTLTGNLKIGNTTIYSGGSNGGINSVLIGDDVTLGDCNAGGMLGMKSTGTNAGIRLYNSSGGLIGGFQSTNGTAQWLNSSGTAYNLLHNGNYTDYTVTKTGSGASGTWGINVTGSAYRLRAEPSNTINSTANDTTANWGKQLVSAHWYNTNGLLNHQPTQWFHLLNLTQGGSEVCQIAMISNNMWIRGGNSSGWGSNFTPVLTTANQSSITSCNRGSFGTIVTASSDTYVAKAKGTYTGNGYTGYCVAGRDTGHFYQLNWTGSALQHYVDGTNVGSSDMRLKKDKKRITDDDQILDVIDECGIYSYKHIDDNDKTSFGIMAQAFKWKCKERGLNPEDYVLFQKTEHSIEDDMLYYTIEYDQYLVLKCASQDRKINRLEQRIKELESKM